MGPRPIQKVAVVGAGVGGLSLARALEQLCPDLKVNVFERSPVLKPALGGSFGVSGGASVLVQMGLGDE
jgi:2-polyprenyl-6-methoxyphenol hydroxylase-like FAD-dependent oxidoreductase